MEKSRLLVIGHLIILLVLLLVFILGNPNPAIAHGDGINLGIIHACVDDSNGKLRIVTGDEECPKKESALDWNAQGPPGPEGPQGSEGPQGPEGPQGSSGVTFYTVTTIKNNIPAFSESALTADCNTGDWVTGGGHEISSTNKNVWVVVSHPYQLGLTVGWNVVVNNDTNGVQNIKVFAVCADITP